MLFGGQISSDPAIICPLHSHYENSDTAFPSKLRGHFNFCDKLKDVLLKFAVPNHSADWQL